jgi:prepilin-type N-terminal cleavage/methylation domain-containing protein
MIQGSNMTIGHQGMKKGMRNGLSLMEMLISIVLFGLLSTMSFKYYKNYYDTSFAAKQARIYVIIDQAGQLNNAFELYTTKNGKDPEDVNALVQDKILTAIPVTQPLISNEGWVLDLNRSVSTWGSTVGVTSTAYNADDNGSDVVFYLSMADGNASNPDKMDYCNILTNAADTTWEMNNTRAETNTSNEHFRAGRTAFFCDVNTTTDRANENNATLRLTFVTRLAH